MDNKIAVNKDVLEYFKDRYIEEQSRFDHFEAKCSRFLTFVTVIIALLTGFYELKANDINFSECKALQIIMSSSFIFGCISISISWFFSLAAMKISECSIVPNNRNTAEYLIGVDPVTAAEYILASYIDTIEMLSPEIQRKSDYLNIAYKALIFSAGFITATIISSVISEVIK